MARHYRAARDSVGNAIASPTITVFRAGTTEEATIHSDALLTVAKANPFTGNADGTYDFYARSGYYKVRIEKPGYTTVDIDNVLVGGNEIHVGEFGDIFEVDADVSSVIQAALDYAASIGGGRVVMPAGSFVCKNLTVDSFVHFDLNDCELLAAPAATGSMITNENEDSKGWIVSDGLIDCRGANIIGVLIDQDGGSWGVNYADPEPRLSDLRVQNSATDAFRFVGARVINVFRCRVRACTGDGFSLLAGSTDETNDCLFVECSVSSARDLIHAETSSNTWVAFKGGEATRYGIFCGTGCQNSAFSGCIIDHCTTANYRIEGNRNTFSACGNQAGQAAGPAILFVSPASFNTFDGFVWGDGSTPQYAVTVPASCVGNEIHLGVEGTLTGTVGPTSDLALNLVVINGERHGVRLVGKLDIIQQRVIGFSTQTNLIALYEKSDGTDLFAVDNNGIIRIPAALDASGLTTAAGAIGPGTWTPTITHVTNVSASSARLCKFIRVGTHVFFWGAVDIDPTAGSTRTVFAISVPITSNFALLTDAAGAMGYDTGTVIVNGTIIADTVNDRMQFAYTCDAGAASQTITFSGGFQIK